MAASALKMAAICAVLAILLSAAGQPAVAYVDGQALACPSPATLCRAECVPACETFANVMCDKLCSLTPGALQGADQTCVNQFFTPCQVACKNMCEPLPVPVQTP